MIKIHRVTKLALEKVKKELYQLVNVERVKVIREIQEARALGDLSENADYDSAKNQQSFVEGRISELEEIINHHEIIEEKESFSIVEIGSKVKIFDLSENKEFEYEILGAIDNDPANFKISNESPLAQAVIGKKVGQQVDVLGIPEPYKVKILKIS